MAVNLFKKGKQAEPKVHDLKTGTKPPPLIEKASLYPVGSDVGGLFSSVPDGFMFKTEGLSDLLKLIEHTGAPSLKFAKQDGTHPTEIMLDPDSVYDIQALKHNIQGHDAFVHNVSENKGKLVFFIGSKLVEGELSGPQLQKLAVQLEGLSNETDEHAELLIEALDDLAHDAKLMSGVVDALLDMDEVALHTLEMKMSALLGYHEDAWSKVNYKTKLPNPLHDLKEKLLHEIITAVTGAPQKIKKLSNDLHALKYAGGALWNVDASKADEQLDAAMYAAKATSGTIEAILKHLSLEQIEALHGMTYGFVKIKDVPGGGKLDYETTLVHKYGPPTPDHNETKVATTSFVQGKQGKTVVGHAISKGPNIQQIPKSGVFNLDLETMEINIVATMLEEAHQSVILWKAKGLSEAVILVKLQSKHNITEEMAKHILASFDPASLAAPPVQSIAPSTPTYATVNAKDEIDFLLATEKDPDVLLDKIAEQLKKEKK